MVQDIMRDETFLSQKAEPATLEDLPVAQDLLDTLAAHKDGCVGMAANMIGVCKRIIVFDNEGKYMVMLTRKSSRSPALMRRRRTVSPSPEPGRPVAGSPSRCSIRTRNFRFASKPSLAGRPRSSSTRSTTARGC